jgi:hypothetical protein
MHAAQGRRRPPNNALRTDPDNCTSPAAQIGCDLDSVIALFRKAMPDCGLKLLVPPPLPDGSAGRLSLSAWRRDDQSARVHSGATAREAARLLLDSDVQDARERRHRAGCPLCHGIGWYIASDGIGAICVHPSTSSG